MGVAERAGPVFPRYALSVHGSASGKSPSGGKKSLPFGGANANSLDAGLMAQIPQASRIPTSPTSPGSPVPVLSIPFEPPPMPPLSPPFAISGTQLTRHSVDAVPAR